MFADSKSCSKRSEKPRWRLHSKRVCICHRWLLSNCYVTSLNEMLLLVKFILDLKDLVWKNNVISSPNNFFYWFLVEIFGIFAVKQLFSPSNYFHLFLLTLLMWILEYYVTNEVCITFLWESSVSQAKTGCLHLNLSLALSLECFLCLLVTEQGKS